jgi:hypothetical protein
MDKKLGRILKRLIAATDELGDKPNPSDNVDITPHGGGGNYDWGGCCIKMKCITADGEGAYIYGCHNSSHYICNLGRIESRYDVREGCEIVRVHHTTGAYCGETNNSCEEIMGELEHKR